jgi:hypothetical protein
MSSKKMTEHLKYVVNEPRWWVQVFTSKCRLFNVFTDTPFFCSLGKHTSSWMYFDEMDVDENQNSFLYSLIE